MMICPGCGVAHAQTGDSNAPLEQLLNLGKTSAEWLRQANINSFATLVEIGSVSAYLQMKALGLQPGLNLLYALEGAIHGQHWLETKRLHKARLLLQLAAAREPVPS